MKFSRRNLLTGAALALVGEKVTRAGVVSGQLPWEPNAGEPPQAVREGPWKFFTSAEAAAVEALAQGCALVASRRGGLPEIAGDAALFVDPSDTAAFAATLRQLASDEFFRKDMQTRGRAQAAEKLEIGFGTARLDAVRGRLLA